MVAQACNPHTQEVEIVSLGQPCLYLRLSQNKNKTQKHCHFKIDQTEQRGKGRQGYLQRNKHISKIAVEWELKTRSLVVPT